MPISPITSKSLPFPAIALWGTVLVLLSAQAGAETPYGWINANNVSAYTLDAGEIQIGLGVQAVNDDIDFINYRDRLIAGDRRLTEDSGDLNGLSGDIRWGATSYLTLFYQQRQQDLTVKLGPINSLNILDIDKDLQTTRRDYGLIWNFYESGFADPSTGWHSASIELTRNDNETDDFEVSFDEINLSSNTQVIFSRPQTAALNKMEDKGWRGRIIYSWPLFDQLNSSIWLGYAHNDASSGTTSNLSFAPLKKAFEQEFKVDTAQASAGINLNWQITARLPLQLSYEYITITSSDIAIERSSTIELPGFLSADSLGDESANHILSGSLSYWVTPKLNVSLTGRLFTNQFLGVIPHYDNPLSGSFSDTAYGYAGVHIGFLL